MQLLRASTRSNLLEQDPHVLDLAFKIASLSGLPAPEWVLVTYAGVERFGHTPVPANISATNGLGEARLDFKTVPAPEVSGKTVFWY